MYETCETRTSPGLRRSDAAGRGSRAARKKDHVKKPPLPPLVASSEKEGRLHLAHASPVGSDLELPELDQLDNRLRTTFDIELLHHIRDMVPDRFLAYEQLLSDIASRFVLHKQFENFAFPIGQKEFAFVVVAFQRVSPLLAREWNDYKVKGYSQLYHMKGFGRWCDNPVILGVQP